MPQVRPSGLTWAVRGMLDDYAFTALACLDAYEMTGAISYFNFARRIADEMIKRFADAESGGFFDTEASLQEKLQLGALSARRKPFQDAPTPAGNPGAAIALLRLHAYTNEARYHDIAEATLKIFAGAAEQFGIYAGTYGIAATWLWRAHTQLIVVGEDEKADALLKAAIAPFAVNKSVVHLTDSEAVAQNLPPALAVTVPHLPGLKEGKSIAIVCTNFSLPASDQRSGRAVFLAAPDCRPGDLTFRAPRAAPASRPVVPQAVPAASEKSIVERFEGAQLQPCPEPAERVRRCRSLVFVITRRPSGRRGICLSTLSAACLVVPLSRRPPARVAAQNRDIPPLG